MVRVSRRGCRGEHGKYECKWTVARDFKPQFFHAVPFGLWSHVLTFCNYVLNSRRYLKKRINQQCDTADAVKKILKIQRYF
jgi:hypothetical protein